MLCCCTSVMCKISLFNRPQSFNRKQSRLRESLALNTSSFINADGDTNHKQGVCREKNTFFPKSSWLFLNISKRNWFKRGGKKQQRAKIHCIIQVSGGTYIYLFYFECESLTVGVHGEAFKSTLKANISRWLNLNFGWTAPLRQSSLWGGVTN